MKKFKEFQDWLRERDLLNAFYYNFYTQRIWGDEYNTLEELYQSSQKRIIMEAFTWHITPQEADGTQFWYDIHNEFKHWF